MPKIFLRVGRWLVVGALFCGIGGHLAVLQTVAWASMIVEYSHGAAVTDAVQKTFDGQHPCQICKAIQKSRQSDKKNETIQSVKKIELFDELGEKFVFKVSASHVFAVGDQFSEARSERPTAPPPRGRTV